MRRLPIKSNRPAPYPGYQYLRCIHGHEEFIVRWSNEYEFHKIIETVTCPECGSRTLLR